MVSTSQNSLLTTKILRIARRLTNCDGDLKVGAGNAIFTAECYNFNCIRTYVKYGNPICPTGDAKWKDIPSVGPAPAALRPRIPKRRIHNRVISEPLVYNDDDPIDFQSNFSSNNNSIIRSIDIKTHTEFPAVPLSVSQENFHILVNLKSNLTGNSDTCRTPIYLVTVLDINSSMRGEKIQLLKGAMRFVIQNLGPSDRLSVISFSSDAHRLFPLLLMTDSGKQRALQALNSLFASSMTNIVEGLKKGTKVIEDRRTQSSKGTFSFIEAERVIQEAFPQRIGGLLSVVLQDLQVHIQSLDPHLCISQLKAGGYSTSLTGENQVGSVDIGDLYANEERDFLVLVNLPVATDGNSNDQMKLVSVWCVYKDPFIKEPVTTEAIQVKLQRPEIVNEDMAVSIEVDRQKNRIQISETASAHAGDTFSADLDVELEEVRSRMVNKKTYERAGRGYLLSGMRAHSRQTAATRGVSVGSMYDTDCMRGMVNRSRATDKTDKK
ncbi:E3 ubiquitin-protein ligase WAVH1-like [Papaver somniferum]|uniref:E3 ubiquitin-protein ligase WAVH1-like n=1 Tax=Papaver somniferum TaxID=3469 RepID=UPI000E6FDD03|nr:E3 ubiquitin-protein ligase WAVH1-like [Papaver somniferum]